MENKEEVKEEALEEIQEPVKNEKIKVKGIKEKKDNKIKKNNKDKEKIEKLEKEKSELNDKVLRLSAEMQNMRRRYDEEINKICKYDGEELVIKLLTIVDNFERAIKLDDRDLSDELSKFLSGFKMIYTNLLNILDSMDVKVIEAQGLEFDPTKMEAVLTEKDENLPANVVIEVLQKGYTYKDKVIRVAMVKVNE
ncbi:MAG TPA: nucleotide exchange factor GrpE [Candidatus Onthocola stercorigallinarum]|nr:nucleotide exchange factor GrpE [Candidatus Onthocola stercorigallinarum]